MRKAIISGIMIVGFLTVVSVPVVFAQEPETTREQEKYELIVEGALDQIEKNLDPAIVSEELSIGPVISGTSKVGIRKGIPVEPENFEDVVEIRPDEPEEAVEVLIGARILKIVLNDEHPAGVDWEAIVSEYQELALSGDGDEDREQLSLGTISQEDYDILLEALDMVGVVRTVFEEDTRTENETIGTISSPASLCRDEDIRFYLTPRVKKDEPLEVAIKMKEADQESVTVQMENGETIVIGGLFEDVMVASTWKIPLLGDIPLLGFVFRDEGEESRKAEIITFLTVKTVEKKL